MALLNAERDVKSGIDARNGGRQLEHVVVVLIVRVGIDAGQVRLVRLLDGDFLHLHRDRADSAGPTEASGISFFHFATAARFRWIVAGQSVAGFDDRLLIGSRAGCMSPRDLESCERREYRLFRDSGDFRTQSGRQCPSAADEFDVALLEAEVRASDAKEHHGQEE